VRSHNSLLCDKPRIEYPSAELNSDLTFQKALHDLLKASNTDESAESQERRIREAQQKLPLDLCRQLHTGENAFWALLPILKVAGLTSADSLLVGMHSPATTPR